MSDMPEGSPWVQYNGGITTAEDAAAKMEALKADPVFNERVRNGDLTAYAERTELWRIAHGMTPKPVAPVNEVDVFTQMSERATSEFEKRADSLRADGFSEDGIYEALNGRPMLFEERRWHEQELARLKRDQAWVKRYFEGDREARLQMRKHTTALTFPVGTLEDIRAWERAHNRKAS